MSMKDRLDALCKGTEGIKKNKENPVDPNAVILGRFLEGYVPVDQFGPGVTVMSTDDIITALSDMAEISQADVNRVLAVLGYKPGHNSAGSFGWLMKHIEL